MSLSPTDCPRCGLRFLGEPGSYCEECAAEVKRGRYEKRRRYCHYIRVCPWCRKEFDTTRARQIYDSPLCQSQHERRAREKEENRENDENAE